MPKTRVGSIGQERRSHSAQQAAEPKVHDDRNMTRTASSQMSKSPSRLNGARPRAPPLQPLPRRETRGVAAVNESPPSKPQSLKIA